MRMVCVWYSMIKYLCNYVGNVQDIKRTVFGLRNTVLKKNKEKKIFQSAFIVKTHLL